MTPRTPTALLLLGVFGVLGLLVAAPHTIARADEPAAAALDASLVPALDAALAASDPRTHADDLWRGTILIHGSPEPLIELCEGRLRERIEEILFESEEEDPSLDTPEILALRRLTGRFARILGDLPRARGLVEKIPADAETVADLLERAQVLDALGENEEAHEVFGRVLDLEIEPELRNEVLLRRALLEEPKKNATARSGNGGASAARGGTIAAIPLTPIGATIAAAPSVPSGGSTGTGDRTAKKDDEPSPLARFARAEERAPELANRAAMILALRGEQEDAIEAFSIEDGEGSHRYRQEVRLAEWALEAEEWDRAQSFSWAAVGSAKLKRDRRYALTILVESYRRDGALAELIERFTAADDLTDESRRVWIDLLRETGRVEEALALFRSAAGDEFTIDMRRELLEMCRETGQEQILVEAYGDLIDEEPRFIEWREGLSRYHLERGDREAALEVWRPYLGVTDELRYRMAAAGTLMEIGLDELATEFARACIPMGDDARNGSLLFLFELRLSRSDTEGARAALVELEREADPTDPVHKDISDAYARLGDKERAVEVLEAFRGAMGDDSNPDTDMKLALLLSDIGEEERALDLWGAIWRAVDSIPRRRYVEERMMAVAARLGKLAKVAVDLERKLEAGTADDRDVGLLVRLYTHVKDPVSATEIVEVHWKDSGRKATDVLAEKARIFVACEDFYNYEKVVQELIEIDPEGRPDYLRQLAMAKLESGQRDQARKILERLKEEDADSASLEFEAGILSLAGLREDALAAYRRSLAEHPERIDTYLLLSNLQKELGRHARSAGMFQYLAETAEKDDLFTIAIDGILNMRDGRSNTGAPDRLVEWARRIVLERISRRSDKLYLYRLLADLAEELDDRDGTIRALKTALPIAGEQRTPILRELMALAKPEDNRRGVVRIINGRVVEPEEGDADNTEQLMFGRRLLGQGELVPPQVYLELGQGFLRSKEVVNATKTFQRMSQLPEYGEMQRQIAEAFEEARYPKEALRVYERILTVEPSDVALLTKVGELQEQLGRDDIARELYGRGLATILSRRPERKVVKKDDDEGPAAPANWYSMNRNIDPAEQYYSRVLSGVIATEPAETMAATLDEVRAAIDEELATVVSDEPAEDLLLEEFPRLEGRLRAYRRLAIAFGQPERVEVLDRRILAAFPDDEDILESMVRSRIGWGYVVAARRLIEESGRPADQTEKLMLLAGGVDAENLPGVIAVGEATALILPLLAEGRDADVRELLTRLDLSTGEPSDQQRMPILVSTAMYLGDAQLVLGLSRHWLNLMVQHSPGALYSGVENILRKSGTILGETERRSLVEQLVDAINEEPDKFSSFISQLPELQKSMSTPLFTTEQVEELINKRLGASDQFIYGIPEMFALLSAEDRGPIARRIWSKIPDSQAGLFAIMLLPILDQPVDAPFAEFLGAAFVTGVEKAEDISRFTYMADQLTDQELANPEVALRFVRTLRAKDPLDPGYRAGEAKLLAKLGREDEGWQIAAEIYRERLRSLGSTPDYRVTQAIRSIQEAYGDESSERFLALIEEAERDAGPDAELTKLRLDLLRRQDDAEAYRAAVEAAVDEFPEEASLLVLLRHLYQARGESFAALEVQQRIVDADPEDERQKEDLVRRWRGLRNPVEVLRLLREDDEEEKDGGAGAAPAATKDRTPAPTIVRVKDQLEAGEPADARSTFRRLWRSFPAAGNRNPFASVVIYTSTGMIRSGYGSTGRQVWPPDPPTEEEKEEARQKSEEKRYRGGLPDLAPPEQKDEDPEEIRTAQDVLVELDFGEDEIRRQLRSFSGGQLDSDVASDIFRALARDLAARRGAETVVGELLERERSGDAGKVEYGLLFALLEMAEERDPEELDRTLQGLLENLSPTDTGQLQRLARLYAKSDMQEKAGTIYRWCAVVQPDRSLRYWDTAGDLLGEVIAELEGDERIRTVEAVLALSDPGEDAFWGRDGYESLVIQTWEKLLGADRALERARRVCETSTVLAEMPKRNSARAAAYLYARAGEIDRALECLEVSLCELEVPADLKYPWYRYQFENPGWIGYEDLRRFFPEDASDWPAAAEWYTAVAERVAEWQDAERLREDSAFQLMALAALRLHEVGDAEGGAELLERAAPLAGENANHLLWIADIARRTGDEARAVEIERTLLAEGRLNLGRTPEVIAGLREAGDPARALELGAPIAEHSLDPVILEELVLAAEAAGRADEAASWRERKAAAELARDELEAYDEEQREKGT